MNHQHNAAEAFGAPGIEPRWTSSAKEGIGTAYLSVFEFTCFWTREQRWEGRNWQIIIF
jgi:hypothetical protein